MSSPPQGGVPLLPVPGQPAPMQPGDYQSDSIANVTSFSFDKVSPPSSLYLQRDDQLIVVGVSNLAGENFRISGRFLRVPEPQGGQPSEGGVGRAPGQIFTRGVVETFADTLIPSITGSLTSLTKQFAEGYLLNLSVTAANAINRGRSFARASIFRSSTGFSASGVVLFSDYVTQNLPIGWPGGRQQHFTEGPGWRHSLQQANPGAGADWTFQAGISQRIAVTSFTAQLVTSAAVANRNVELIVDDGSNIVWRASAPASVAASTTQFIGGGGSNSPTGVITTDFTVMLPPGLVLQPNWRLRVATTNIQAADQWSSIWLNVEEWLDSL